MEKFTDFMEFLLTKKRLLIGIIILILLGSILVFLLCLNNNRNNDSSNEFEDILIKEEKEVVDSIDNNDIKCMVTVDIKGEVVMPGLYQIECDKRIYDVINLAGGTTKNADTSVLNLSKKVFDEMVIIIYSKKEVENFDKVQQEETKKNEECKNKTEVRNDACIEEKNKTTTDVIITESSINTDTNSTTNNEIIDIININKASQIELTKLPGIGDSKALKIIEYRNTNGFFKTIDEIKNVKGIGNSIFEKIKAHITV